MVQDASLDGIGFFAIQPPFACWKKSMAGLVAGSRFCASMSLCSGEGVDRAAGFAATAVSSCFRGEPQATSRRGRARSAARRLFPSTSKSWNRGAPIGEIVGIIGASDLLQRWNGPKGTSRSSEMGDERVAGGSRRREIAAGRTTRRRRLLRWLARAAVLALALAALYGGLALILPRIPLHSDWKNPESGIVIYVESNGVHTDFVLPARTATI